MLKNFNPGMLGIRGLDLAGTIGMASRHGYDSIDFNIREAAELAEAKGVDYVKQLFRDADVQPGLWSFPVAWRDDSKYQFDLVQLSTFAGTAQALGCLRTATWCPPGSDELEFAENFAWHVDRFRPIAQVLKDYGCRLGLEFIGPKTLRSRYKHAFIHTMDGLLELAEAIGTANVGLLLDAFHLYTSDGEISDLDKVSDTDIVTVHINNALAGVLIDEQIDGIRCLPMETNVIDIPSFLAKLHSIGYDGPITTEPFNQTLRDVATDDPDHAAEIVMEHMNQAWSTAGLEVNP